MESSPLRILIAWRPGQTSTEALAYAAWLSRTCKVQVRVVSILSRGWPLTSLARLSDNDSWVAAETKALNETIKSALKAAGLRKGMLADDPIQVIEASSESTAICRAADDFDAHIVLLGSQTDSPAGKFRMGSTSDALLHYSSLPVGLAPKSPKLSKNGVTRVNICYIDTRQSHSALNKAADLAQRWEVPLRLISFTPRGATMYPTENGYGNSSDLMVEWREQAMALLDRGVDRAHTRYPNLVVDTEVSCGNGWEQAINGLKWKKGDLLVLGSSTLGPFGRIFIGSSTNQILRHSPVPMVITPA